MTKKVVIMGAAGRDFHNFNVYFRVGIPIVSEEDLPKLITENDIFEVILSYSDLSHENVMHKASLVLAHGADFRLLGTKNTMLSASVPIISICAVRTGCGKSQTTRKVCDILKAKGNRVVAIRHPMPYGNLVAQAVQRFESMEDLDKHDCTIEEREEYEPHINSGIIVYAGVDYKRILSEAEKEADIIVWDGGNNDFSFYKSDLYMVVMDPHRPNHEVRYHPGETNFRMADVLIINKIGTASRENINILRKNIENINPNAVVIEAESTISVDDPSQIRGKRVLVVEDGPSVTHGEMPYGAGEIAAEKFHAQEIVDPRPHAVGSIKETFEKYPHLTNILPAMGYTDEQIDELQQTINSCDCDVVVAGTPIDLARVVSVNKPVVRVKYELQEMGEPNLETVLKDF
jgi:predicted GTPase